MLQTLKQELAAQGFGNDKLPELLTNLVGSIPNMRVPAKMKLAIACSEMVLAASHTRRNIVMWDGSVVPINSITFCIAGSGVGKDSSVNAVRKCFKDYYIQLDTERRKMAISAAIAAAEEAGEADSDKWEVHKHFFNTPDSLFLAPDSTIKGMHGHFNKLEESGIGAGYSYSGEIGSEFENGNAKGLLLYMAEVFDIGKKEVKVIGNKEEQLKPLENLPVNGLYCGSPANLLYDENIKQEFKKEFGSRAGRRSTFNFNFRELPLPTGLTGDELIDIEIRQEDEAIAKTTILNKETAIILAKELRKINQPITTHVGVRRLFSKYKAYNERLSMTISPLHPISRIVRAHMQWKALKIAGAFTILDNRDEMSVDDYMMAITYVETFKDDMSDFENELVKGKHELFAGYMHSIAVNGKSQVSLHDLRKLQYIGGTGSVPKMRELVELASSYDQNGIYNVEGSSIHYELIEKTEVTGVSFLEVSGSKEHRAKTCTSGYQYIETDFTGLANSLSTDLAFTPFELQDGVRGMDNIISGTTWICFDIDDTKLTDEEVHFIISDVNHHIARTSNPDNAFKYRVIIQLDAPVKLDRIAWKYFIESVSDDLGLPIDKLPQSQIFFGYAGREVLSVVDQSPIEIKAHVTYAMAQVAERTPQKVLTTKEKSAALNAPMTAFEFAFEAPNGQGSRMIYKAAYKSFKLGATAEESIALIHAISDYWDYPLEAHRLATIEGQIRNFS